MRSTDDDEGGALLTREELAAVTHALQHARRKLPPPSYAMAPAAPLAPWQRVALSTVRRLQCDEEDQRQANMLQARLTKELEKYRADARAREERLRRQQREARAQAGARLATYVRRFWARRGDTFQGLLRVEFDVLKRHRDKRRQEDLLRETEELTKRLLDSLLSGTTREGSGSPTSSSGPPQGLESAFRQSGRDGSVEIESSLALLDTEGGRRPLRHYQRSALHWMIHLFESKLNGVLADEMGLGKTVQTIALLCYYAQYKNDWGPHLIVVPTTVVLNWKAELQRWAPGLKVLTYIGSSKERAKLRQGWTREDALHVCVTSYNLVVQDRGVFRKRPWGFLVLDEAHQVKNFMSKKWQSLFDLQAEYRLLLTGTPLQNSIMELWSLFHFLLPFASAFRSNDEFKEWFSNPMDDMITGRSSLNEDIVRRLQALLRPFMLRRLKRDVETQLPTKTERVVMCHLSRRQRSLYDDYMELADTRARLRGGGAGGVLSVLLGLRKVCDHPDLFEERPTVTPLALDRFAMVTVRVPRAILLLGNDYRGRYRFPCPASLEVVDVNADGPHVEVDEEEEYSGAEGAVSGAEEACFDWLPCRLTRICLHVGTAAAMLVALERGSASASLEAPVDWHERFHPRHLRPDARLQRLETDIRRKTAEFDQPPASPRDAGFLAACRQLVAAARRAACVIREGHEATRRFQHTRYQQEQTTLYYAVPSRCLMLDELATTRIQRTLPFLCPSIAERAEAVMPVVQRVAVYVPAAMAVFPPHLHWALPVRNAEPFSLSTRESLAPLLAYAQRAREAAAGGREWRRDVFDGSRFLAELWPMHVRRCFSFPDKRLIIHDCGKLQYLATALKEMRQEGHRVLIFTQFVLMLNILERFLALIGVAYLRLDGSTRAEMRQAMVDRFNEDSRVTCMILSTRSGGIGLNLTGADTVIFYDSDWNPTMDLQAQDRCHRIGQTRPVTIYRLISEHTVEEAILQKARERKRLNNVVIRGGQFHTLADVGEAYDDTAAAFAALSDPVNLRSFFHDYDEDVTLPVTDGAAPLAAAPADILAEMERAEDAEDREAAAELRREMHQRATDEAAEQADAADAEGGPLWSEMGDAEGAGSAAAPAVSRGEAVRGQEERLRAALAVTGDDERGHPELVAAKLMPAVRKRQRDVLAKCRSPLDRLLTAQYGVSSPADAWARYTQLRDEYAGKLQGGEAASPSSHDPDEADVFPPFRPRLELCPP